VNPHYRNEQGLPELGITNAEEARDLANKISSFLTAGNDIRLLLAQAEPEVVKSFRVITDIFKSLGAADLSARKFGGELSVEEKKQLNQYLSKKTVDDIERAY